MLLDSVLENKGTDMFVEGTEIDMSDALLECAVGIEEAYGDMMVEQAKCEFKQYVNEGKIDALNEGVLDSVKNFFKKIWQFIKKYFNKLKTWVTGLNQNAFQYFQVNKAKIEAGIKSVTRFYGYPGLKNFDTITKFSDQIKTATNLAVQSADKLIKKLKDLDHSTDKKGSGESISDITKNALSTLKQTIVGNSSSTEESFTAIIKDDIRGSSKEIEVKYETLAEIEKVVGSEAGVREVGRNLKKLEDDIKDLQNKAFGLEHQKEDQNKSGSAVNYLTKAATLITTASTTTSSMIKDVVAQANRFQHAAVNGKSDDERKNEDTEMTADEAKAYLESIGIA